MRDSGLHSSLKAVCRLADVAPLARNWLISKCRRRPRWLSIIVDGAAFSAWRVRQRAADLKPSPALKIRDNIAKISSKPSLAFWLSASGKMEVLRLRQPPAYFYRALLWVRHMIKPVVMKLLRDIHNQSCAAKV